MVYLGLDLLLVGGLGWGVAGAAAAASAGQYIGFLAMAAALVRRGSLDLGDLRVLPTPQQLGSTLLTGLALALCIGSVATSVLSATSMASGTPCTLRFGSTAKVLLKCKLKYYRISECPALPPPPHNPPTHSLNMQLDLVAT